MSLVPRPERPRSAAARHSENTDDFSRLQDGPVKGMSSRHSGSSAAIRSLDGILTNQVCSHGFLGPGGMLSACRPQSAGCVLLTRLDQDATSE